MNLKVGQVVVWLENTVGVQPGEIGVVLDEHPDYPLIMLNDMDYWPDRDKPAMESELEVIGEL